MTLEYFMRFAYFANIEILMYLHVFLYVMCRLSHLSIITVIICSCLWRVFSSMASLLSPSYWKQLWKYNLYNGPSIPVHNQPDKYCEICLQLLALSEEHSQLYSSVVNFFSFSMLHLMYNDSLKQVLLTIRLSFCYPEISFKAIKFLVA